MRIKSLRHQFVELIPSTQEEGVLYVSMEYATAVHRCCCGCGAKVVTPLAPTDWTLTFDGRRISLDPSIGNWALKCQSHYWIRHNRVEWAPRWSRSRVDANRRRSQEVKRRHFDEIAEPRPDGDAAPQVSRLRHALDRMLRRRN
jgi:Family of unknown function (DUF6527)